MLKFYLNLIIILLFVSLDTKAQKIYQKTAIIRFQPSNSVSIDGLIYFEIELRIADCLSYIEIKDLEFYKDKKNIWDKIYDWWWFKIRKNFDFQISKILKLELKEENYFLKEDSEDERIYMKCELLNLKSLFGRKRIEKKIEINIYSKSGKKIYSKNLILNKLKLIKEGEVRLGVEPS